MWAALASSMTASWACADDTPTSHRPIPRVGASSSGKLLHARRVEQPQRFRHVCLGVPPDTVEHANGGLPGGKHGDMVIKPIKHQLRRNADGILLQQELADLQTADDIDFLGCQAHALLAIVAIFGHGCS